LAGSETFFLSVIVTPMWKVLNNIYEEEFNGLMNNLDENIKKWKEIKDGK